MTALENIVSPEIIHRFGWTLLHFVWQAAAVALVSAIVLGLVRKSSANVRYIIACLALALIVLLPAITFQLVSAPELICSGNPGSVLIPQLTESLHTLSDIDVPLQRPMQEMAPISWTQRATNLFTPILPYVVSGWLIGVFALSIWHVGGWAQLQRLRRKMVRQVDLALQSKLNELAERLKVHRAVQLVESALVQIPTVVGWVRPVILLPATALTGLTSDQLQALLAHELAHIRRHDYLINMLQTVVEVLGFYHPAVWWLSHKIRVERENCCDDLAVGICGDTMRYAKALTEMEKLRSGYAELALAASGANLSRRISRLIGKDPVRKTPRNWVPATVVATLIIALAIPTTLALSGSDSEETPPAVVSGRTTPTTTDDALPPTPVLVETADTPQILLDCKLFELPSDSEFFRCAGQEQLAVGSGKDLVSLLASLVGDRNVRVLATPQVIMLDGKEACVTVGEELPYIVGYGPSDGAQDTAKPITKSVLDGVELQVKGETVGSNGVDLNVHLTRSRTSFERQKDHRGREIQTPKRFHSDSATSITVQDGETILIGGLKNEQSADDTVILMITPHIIRKADARSVFAEADLMTEPTDDAKSVKPVEDPVAMAIHQALAAAEKLRAAGKQLDDHREILEILSEQGYTIKAADFSTDKYKLIISKPINGDDDRKGQLVVRLTNQDDEWLLDNIDFEPHKRVRERPSQLRQRPPKPEQAEQTQPLPEAGGVKAVQDPVAIPMNIGIREVLAVVEKLMDLEKGRDDFGQICQILRAHGFTVAQAHPFSGDKCVFVISKPISNHNRKGMLICHLIKQDDKWLIDNIDFKSTEGVKKERAGLQWQAPEAKQSVPTDPNHAEAQDQGLENLLSSLKYLTASQPDAEPKHADEALLRALEYLYPEDSVHATYALLAARSAEKGSFEEAIKYQERAIELAKTEKYYGIGVAFQNIDSGIRVTDVLVGAPAEKAGLKPGDVIEAVNGYSIEGLSQYTAAVRICGPKNSNVRLTVRSPGQDTAKELTLKREFLLQGWPGLQQYQWRLDAYKAGKTWPEYRWATGQTEDQSQQVTTIFELKHCDAEELATLLNRIVKDRQTIHITDGLPPQAFGLNAIAVVVDQNKLIVVANKKDTQAVKDLIAELDTPLSKPRQAPADTVSRSFELRHVDCKEAARVLVRALESIKAKEDDAIAQGTDQVGTSPYIRIVPNTRSNRLIICAREQDMDIIEALIAEFDVSKTDDKKNVVLELKYAEPEQVAAILRQLLTDTAELTPVPQPRTNRLLVRASPQDIKKVEDLIERLDVAYKGVIEDIAPEQDQTKFGYVDVTTQEYAAEQAEQLRALKDQRSALADKLQSLENEICLLQHECGTTDLTWRQEVKLQRIGNILNEHAKIESRRLQLESELLRLEQSKDTAAQPQERLKARQEYLNNDPTVKALAEKIAQVEMGLSLARQTFADAHPEVKKKIELLKALNKRLGELKRDLAETFDEQMTEQTAEVHKQNLANVRAQLEQTRIYEHRLQETLEKEDAEIIDLGRKQLQIQGLQEQLALSKKKYELLCLRIQKLELELKASPTASGASLEGVITAVDSKNSLAEISIGTANGVKENMRFHVIRGEQFICDVRILDADNAKAVGVLELVQQQPRVGDKVCTSW